MAGNCRTVLVAVDNTKEAECSFEYYLDHVHQHGYRIILLQLMETSDKDKIHTMNYRHAEYLQEDSQKATYVIHSGYDKGNCIDKKVDVGDDTIEVIEDTYTAAKIMESRYAEKLRERKISWRSRTVSMEKAGDVIVEEARIENVVMVAIGTQGVVTMGNGFGPLPEYVMKHAPCQVILLDSSSRDSMS